jgi:hypothetical protein
MRLDPPILEDRPQLRERVFGLTAISAVLIGGALAMNSIITGGWQWGVSSASAEPTPALIYQDDVNQRWNEPAPSVPRSQPVALADAHFTNVAAVRSSAPANPDSLDGAARTATTTSATPRPAPQAQAVDDDASARRFNQIEADMQQALPSTPATSSDASN